MPPAQPSPGDGNLASQQLPLKILMLYSATGGGHRAAARAIEAALKRETPLEMALHDGLVECSPWPQNRAPELYAWMMAKARWLYALGWYLGNGPKRSRLLAGPGASVQVHRLRNLIRTAAPQVVVSVHPLLTHSVALALAALPRRPPLVVCVTDLVTAHKSWFEPQATCTLVPTKAARRLALKCGLDPGRVLVTGEVVHPDCGAAAQHREALRQAYGWREPVILLLAGGDGVGRLDKHLDLLAQAGLKARLVVVCGRNKLLKQKLLARSWPKLVTIHGFVTNLHELMAAADILVTKGGPGSVMEGCAAGLPMLIYDHLPGQEVGNVHLVEEAGLGHYTPRPKQLLAALSHWLLDPADRARAATASKALGEPDSALWIARAIIAVSRGQEPLGPS